MQVHDFLFAHIIRHKITKKNAHLQIFFQEKVQLGAFFFASAKFG